MFTTQNRFSRILLTGSQGQVGRALYPLLGQLGHVLPVTRNELDLTQPHAIRTLVKTFKPTLIINAAAFTAVDRAETESNIAMQVNKEAVSILAEEARQLGALMVHYSTDYVFDGKKSDPYRETDPTGPLNEYGKSKLGGEIALREILPAHLIFRTSWVYAAEGANFLNTMLRLGQVRPELRIVDDQRGAPTSAKAIARITLQVLQSPLIASGETPSAHPHSHSEPNTMAYGTYHLTAQGDVSWFGFAKAIFLAVKNPSGSPRLTPIPTKDYPLPAIRPANSRLNTDKIQSTFGCVLPTWQAQLEEVLQDKNLRPSS